MKRVTEIQQKRQELFFKNRMQAHKATQRAVIKAEIKNGVDILAPAAANKEKVLESVKAKVLASRKQSAEKMQN